MLLMGIDAGSGNNCGVAIYHTKTKIFIKVKKMHLLDLLDLMDKEVARLSGVVLEDPNLDKTTFRVGKTRAMSLKFAQDVGKNKAIANTIIEKCRRLNIDYALVAPSERRRADKGNKVLAQLNMPTKTTQQQFRLLTGFTRPTNEHSRDAGTLVWRLSLPDFEKLCKKNGQFTP
ncbi:MAG: hypothetical protein MK212_10735 [Saprospiraceae bacterium]|nr:hypothetical protein [Saprospiraceae bacterium]